MSISSGDRQPVCIENTYAVEGTVCHTIAFPPISLCYSTISDFHTLCEFSKGYYLSPAFVQEHIESSEIHTNAR